MQSAKCKMQNERLGAKCKMQNKGLRVKSKILAVVLCVLLMAAVHLPVMAEESAVITSFEISPSGVAELCGYVSEEGELVAILMATGDGTVITSETVIYIDQIEAGRNGAFILEFIVPEKWAGGEYTIGVGGQNVSATRQRGSLGALPALVHRVDDNSLRVGVDVYSFGSRFTSENVAASLAYGGNTVFYKIGGMWFDLMDEEAASSAYLVKENAVPEEEYTAWDIRTYYAPGQILEGV